MTLLLVLLLGCAAGAVIGGIYTYKWGYKDGFGLREEVMPQTWVDLEALKQLVRDDATMASDE